MSRQPTPSRDDLADHLRTTLRKQSRSRFRRGIGLWLALAVVLVGGLVWWLYPQPGLPHLSTIAFDQLVLPGGPVPWQAAVQPLEDTDHPLDFRDLRIHFEESAEGPELPTRFVEVRTDAAGLAETLGTTRLQPGESLYLAQLSGEAQRPGTQDDATVYCWPADRPWILVHVTDALIEPAGETGLRKPLDVPPRLGAGETLRTLAGRGYGIVYLAQGWTRPLDYRWTRRWVVNAVAHQRLPAGPVLSGRRGQPFVESLRELRQRHPNLQAVVVAATDRARDSVGLNLPTYQMGSAETPRDVRHLDRWEQLKAIFEGK